MSIDKNMKVLVVDDFPTMRRIVKNQLKKIGLENITEAADGQEAINILEGGAEFGLILSDWNMPVKTGVELLRWVRESDKHKETPFVMVTAEGEKDKIFEAIKLKVNNYIIKPFTYEVLEDKLTKIFE